jgi:hypothetical protein
VGLSKVWINCFGCGPNKEAQPALINANLTCAVTTTNLARQEKYTIQKLDDWKGSGAVILWWNIHQNLSPTSPFKKVKRGTT